MVPEDLWVEVGDLSPSVTGGRPEDEGPLRGPSLDTGSTPNEVGKGSLPNDGT